MSELRTTTEYECDECGHTEEAENERELEKEWGWEVVDDDEHYCKECAAVRAMQDLAELPPGYPVAPNQESLQL